MSNELIKLQDSVEELDIRLSRLSKNAYSRQCLAIAPWVGNATFAKTFSANACALGIELLVFGASAQVDITLDGVAVVAKGSNVVATRVEGVARGEHTLSVTALSGGNCEALLSLSGTNIKIN